jgi:hypothetical protein
MVPLIVHFVGRVAGPLAQLDWLFGGSGEGSGGAGSALPGLMMAAGVALLLGVLLVNLRRRLGPRGGRAQTLDPNERLERMRQTEGMENDLRDMMVELEDLTRRFSAQLDAKSAELEQQIQRAEQTIAELQRLQGQAGNGTDGNAGSVRPTGSANGGAADPGNGNGRPAAETSQESAGAGNDRPAARDEGTTGGDPLAAKICELADAGHEPVEIARSLNEQVGKVELILALRQQQ